MSDPKQLRKEILSARNQQSPQTIHEKSAKIRRQLFELPQLKQAKTVFAYVSFRSEVATEELIDQLIAAGKRVTVPITYVAERRLDAIHITNRATDLVPGYCDIPEPTEELCRTSIVAPQNIDAIILPGSVFDERGGRFGYGGGFYDRFVSQVPKAVRIGLAFDLQIVERAPLQDHDELLDFVVTESRVIKGSRNPGK